jgi:hypothetical protein
MKSFVYKWPFFFWLGVLVSFGGFIAYKSYRVSPSNEEELQQLVESSPKKIRREQKKELRELTQQTRWGVTKEIFVADGPLYRVVNLQAARSEIHVAAKRPHMRVVEHFYDAKVYVQQELFYVTPDGTEVVYDAAGKLIARSKKPKEIDPSKLMPKQRFRYFIAKQAMFDFHTDQLFAEDVQFWAYTADGHERLEDFSALQPDAKGTASKMTLQVGKNEFSAENLKVELL